MTAEQKLRDALEAMGFPEAQGLSAGDLLSVCVDGLRDFVPRLQHDDDVEFHSLSMGATVDCDTAPPATEWLAQAERLIDDLEWQSGILAKFPGGSVEGRNSARAQLTAHLASVVPK